MPEALGLQSDAHRSRRAQFSISLTRVRRDASLRHLMQFGIHERDKAAKGAPIRSAPFQRQSGDVRPIVGNGIVPLQGLAVVSRIYG
jgi:hypothetical protein